MNKRFIPLASDLMKAHIQQKLIDQFLPILNEHKIIQSSKPMSESDNYFMILTGGTENKFLKMLKEMDNPGEIKLIAIGMNNSLPAALEILAYVYQNGLEGNIYYLKDEKDFDGLAD